ncbi:MAG: butyrate kinase [Tissierellia bacterium]|nr:butyrate kinase [Tissierellia bacterium]
MYTILAINPGSTSTKIALFEDDSLIFEKTLRHSSEDLAPYEKIADQCDFRMELILDALKESGHKVGNLEAVVGRGGLVKPIAGGTYAINESLLEDSKSGLQGEHASNLGAVLSRKIADSVGIPSFIVDPVVVDEMQEVARISGHPLFVRKSIFHALNQKAVAYRYAEEVEKNYRDMHLIVAHLGGGVSVGAHSGGRVIDVNNALDGSGPFSPERSGGLPMGDFAKLCFSGQCNQDQIKKMLTGKGGYVAYLGTQDGIEVARRIKEGDEKAKLIQEAFCYQVSKEIGACAAVLKGKVDGIILTGGLVYNEDIARTIGEHVEFIAPVVVYPGEDEMEALAAGALRVMRGEEKAKEYES